MIACSCGPGARLDVLWIEMRGGLTYVEATASAVKEFTVWVDYHRVFLLKQAGPFPPWVKPLVLASLTFGRGTFSKHLEFDSFVPPGFVKPGVKTKPGGLCNLAVRTQTNSRSYTPDESVRNAKSVSRAVTVLSSGA